MTLLFTHAALQTSHAPHVTMAPSSFSLVIALIMSRASAMHKYNCDPLNNFFYAGFNTGPDLQDDGYIKDMKDLTENQMRILRPKVAQGVRLKSFPGRLVFLIFTVFFYV